LKNIKYLSIILFSGGDFSIVVFNTNTEKPVFHKSSHKYIIRKKQGGKQSNKDKSKRVKSAGSQIRRHNEKELHLYIKEVINEFKTDYIQKTDMILIYSPGDNKKILFNEECLDINDKKIFSISTNISKSNYSTAISTFKKISSAYLTKSTEELVILENEDEEYDESGDEMEPLKINEKKFFNVDDFSPQTPLSPFDQKDFEEYLMERQESQKNTMDSKIEKQKPKVVVNKEIKKTNSKIMFYTKTFFKMFSFGIIGIFLFWAFSTKRLSEYEN
jgi:hypothetical protein